MGPVSISLPAFILLVVFVLSQSTALVYLLLKHNYVTIFPRRQIKPAKKPRNHKRRVWDAQESNIMDKKRQLIEMSGKAIQKVVSKIHDVSVDTSRNDCKSPSKSNVSGRKPSTGNAFSNIWQTMNGNQQTIKNSWEINAKELKYERVIGSGSCGKVWLASWHGTPVAVKTFMDNIFDSQEEFMSAVMREISLMSNLHHPNVVMFLGASIQTPELCLLLEYCARGCLHTFLQADTNPKAKPAQNKVSKAKSGGDMHKVNAIEANSHNTKITLSLCIKFCIDIARGVKYLHERCNIMQRDLKSRNVLVDESLNAKLADFGLSRTIQTRDDRFGMTACGTPAWTAPEIITDNGTYTEKVDVYSFGILMWEIFTRQEPYQDNKHGLDGIQIAYAAASQGLRPEIPSFCPEEYRKLMQHCWAQHPEDRPNFAEILERLFVMKKAEQRNHHTDGSFKRKKSGKSVRGDETESVSSPKNANCSSEVAIDDSAPLSNGNPSVAERKDDLKRTNITNTVGVAGLSHAIESKPSQPQKPSDLGSQNTEKVSTNREESSKVVELPTKQDAIVPAEVS